MHLCQRTLFRMVKNLNCNTIHVTVQKGAMETISARDIYKYGSIALIAICIVVVFVGQPIVQLVS